MPAAPSAEKAISDHSVSISRRLKEGVGIHIMYKQVNDPHSDFCSRFFPLRRLLGRGKRATDVGAGAVFDEPSILLPGALELFAVSFHCLVLTLAADIFIGVQEYRPTATNAASVFSVDRLALRCGMRQS
jgi:hypothetical protein